MLRGITELREFGADAGIDALTRNSFPLSEVPAHALAIVATGFDNADAYYRGDYGSGALYCTLKFPELRERPPTTPLEIVSVMTTLISSLELNHRHTFLNYVKANDWCVSNEGDAITARASDGSRVVAHFDELNRITRIHTQ